MYVLLELECRYLLFLLLLIGLPYSSRFFGSKKIFNYFFLLQSRILGKYLYFLQSNKVIYFWQHWQNEPIKWTIYRTNIPKVHGLAYKIF